MPEEKLACLPSGFQRVGDVILLNLRPEVIPYASDIAFAVKESVKGVKAVCRIEEIEGEARMPKAELILGSDTITIHKENGCLYKLDAARIMFSKGNLAERGKMATLARSGEVVVDMFAGIGYFSLPIAIHAKPKAVYAIEINPLAFSYLKENIRLNKVDGKVLPILGDCRKVNLGGIADRVVMGYLPGTAAYLPAAFKALKPAGGVLHYHDTYSESELWDAPIDELARQAERNGFRLKQVLDKRIVKNYAPKVYHIVIDAQFETARPS
ncbi:MAG: class I SAM-dependent methyltransferase family protein [Candidatus Aenigmarchaeota archaeon]|nr:class I SAM-dependent methyltransferase family protein [Candidatus Aenigmarchaeota archaeon]